LSKVAKEVLSQTIKESEIPPDRGLRLKECEGGLTLTIDSPSNGDRIVKRNNRILIIIDKKLEKQIGESTIDISHFKKDAKLVILKHEKVGEAYLENWKGISLFNP